MVVAIVAAAVAGVEVVRAYHDEHDRLQELGDDLIDSFIDGASRAAFHVDNLQARSVADGLMQYEMMDRVTITTELGVELANRARIVDESTSSALADWLFSDVTLFIRELAVYRSEFVAGFEQDAPGARVPVGHFESQLQDRQSGPGRRQETTGRCR